MSFKDIEPIATIIMVIDENLLDKVSVIEAMEPDSCIFECKEGPFSRLASSNERPEVERVEHEVDGILNVEKI